MKPSKFVAVLLLSTVLFGVVKPAFASRWDMGEKVSDLGPLALTVLNTMGIGVELYKIYQDDKRERQRLLKERLERLERFKRERLEKEEREKSFRVTIMVIVILLLFILCCIVYYKTRNKK